MHGTPLKLFCEEKENRTTMFTTMCWNNRAGKGIRQGFLLKRLVFRHNDMTDEEERCGDDENDVIMVPLIETNICIICGEFGRNQELWYRCTICAAWADSECS
ncbi:hypothetical protein C0J52_18224 [Blattella germanica]|nr:hypothetical protein C0J52_18224 [Blattella germanica]